MRSCSWCVAVFALTLSACARTSPGNGGTEPAISLPNGMYAVVAEGSDEATASTAAGTAAHVVLINDGRYTGSTIDPPEWLALSPDPFVPFVLASDPELGQSEKGFASLQLSLAPQNAKILKDFTQEHLNGTVAIVIGGEVVTRHKVKAVITGGKLQITRCADNACEMLRTKLLEP